MDNTTFQQLKESRYYHPILTDVISDYNMMLDMVLHSVDVTEYGYDTVIDSIMFNFLVKYFSYGISHIDKRIAEHGIRLNMVVDANRENIGFLNSIKHYNIKHMDGIRGNFGIFDKRAYMVFIFHKESEHPDQTLWSNSKKLVDRQQELFDRLWNIAIPLSARSKELEYQQETEYQKQITDPYKIKIEINDIINQSRKEILIFASIKILNSLIITCQFLERVSVLLKRGVKIRILTDGIDEDIQDKLNFINRLTIDNPIGYGFSNRLGKINEMIITCDGKYMIHLSIDSRNELSLYFNKDEHRILVQEILFEKHWNEIKSLTTTTIDT